MHSQLGKLHNILTVKCHVRTTCMDTTHDSCCNNNRKLYQLLWTTTLLVQQKSQSVRRAGGRDAQMAG